MEPKKMMNIIAPKPKNTEPLSQVIIDYILEEVVVVS